KDLGFNQENILVIQLANEIKPKAGLIKDELERIPHIMNVTASSDVPYRGFTRNGYFPQGYKSPFYFHVVDIDDDFLLTFDIKLVAGRGFSRQSLADRNAYLINETLERTLSWPDPIGKVIRRGGEHPVIGVVQDFHFSSMYDRIEPLILTNQPWNDLFDVLSVKIDSPDVGMTVRAIKRAFERAVPHAPFDYFFLDEAFDRLYRTEQNIGRMLLYFAGLAILIALLGLFSLASFSIEKRTKEIGIRKTLGASSRGIVVLLSKEFLRLVVIANVIAWPMAWYAARLWLGNFAYRRAIGIEVYFGIGILVLVVALMAMAYQAIRAAIADPVRSLRYE
ncbi:FtsX-like permease family protein, partial [candidate division KSB1 bacterium]|nr:FtsX-like permease family protein [candidate division KSB1 bacterium]